MQPAPVLPDHCGLRRAHRSDRWALQQLVFLLIRSEALGFDCRIIAYRLTKIALLGAVLVAQVWLFLHAAAPVERKLISLTLGLTGIWTIAALGLLVLYVVLIPTEPLFNWSAYWVIDHHQAPIACAAFVNFRQFSVLYHVVVKPTWRRQGLASLLVQQMTQETSLPLYLVCKSSLVPFYTQCGFKRLAWEQLTKPLKAHFIDFESDRRISQVKWEVMGFSQDKDDAPPIAVE